MEGLPVQIPAPDSFSVLSRATMNESEDHVGGQGYGSIEYFKIISRLKNQRRFTMKIELIKMNKCILFVLIFLSSLLLAQDKNIISQSEVPRDSLLKVSRAIVDSARCRVLITVDEYGKPHAREMDPFAPEDDMVIWLGTNPQTRKVKQIQNNPNVSVFYYDPKTFSYVSIEGKALLVNDSDQKLKHWKDYWKVYYPDREKDFILIKVIPDRLEVVSFQYNLFWKTVSYMPHSVDFNTGNVE